ncbi:hypothetical protein B9Z55_025004 [Caenorhabditis nigoni]|nr:hypothetical protein B9Z55_025004 [Caenorhabditis nigoni]
MLLFFFETSRYGFEMFVLYYITFEYIHISPASPKGKFSRSLFCYSSGTITHCDHQPLTKEPRGARGCGSKCARCIPRAIVLTSSFPVSTQRTNVDLFFISLKYPRS